MKLTLLIPYRQREAHLKTQISVWQKQAEQGFFQTCEVLLIELDAVPSPTVQAAIADLPVRYLHCPCSGIFHKTKALNLGLAAAQSQWIVPFDIDLVPVGHSLQRHHQIAQQAPQLLITGYRVMSPVATIDVSAVDLALQDCTIAPEDQPTALWKHLTRHEKFGVLPFFHRDRLEEIGGWDEQFIGWGAEDQDLIERYLQPDRALCRCPELLYLHLFHEPESRWAEAATIEHNRNYYYRKAQAWSRSI